MTTATMTNFDKRFCDYKTPQGLQLRLEEGEFVIVDGFDFMPNGRHSCIVFITNKRFILKDTAFNTGPAVVTIDYLSKADIVYMWFKDIEYFSFKKATPGMFGIRLKGVTTDLSKEAHRKDELLMGQAHNGGFGHTPDSLYERVCTQLAICAKENNFEVLFNGQYEYLSSISESTRKTIKNGETGRMILWSFIAILFIGGGLAYFGGSSGDSRNQQPESSSEVNSLAVPTNEVSSISAPAFGNQYPSTCFTTAYPGTDGVSTKRFGCKVQYNDHSIDVNWSDGILSTFNFWSDGYTIAVDGRSEPASMEVKSWEGGRYYVFTAEKGAQTWIPMS